MKKLVAHIDKYQGNYTFGFGHFEIQQNQKKIIVEADGNEPYGYEYINIEDVQHLFSDEDIKRIRDLKDGEDIIIEITSLKSISAADLKNHTENQQVINARMLVDDSEDIEIANELKRITPSTEKMLKLDNGLFNDED